MQLCTGPASELPSCFHTFSMLVAISPSSLLHGFEVVSYLHQLCIVIGLAKYATILPLNRDMDSWVRLLKGYSTKVTQNLWYTCKFDERLGVRAILLIPQLLCISFLLVKDYLFNISSHTYLLRFRRFDV